MTTTIARRPRPLTAAAASERNQPVVTVEGLRMRYGSCEAVRGVDLEVGSGEIFAFLGPNGAGKTTTVEILEGYRRRTAGRVEVLGEDPATAGREWRGRVGVVLQDSVPSAELTAAETLEMYAGYYAAPLPVAEVLSLVGLDGQAGVRNERLSGGQQRRLDFALALIGDPDVIFLDEPTTGFDPAARRAAWHVIAGLRELGKTIFLTTHYLDEAEALADRIAVIVDGRIVATGTPSTLADRHLEPTRIEISLGGASVMPDVPSDVPVALRDGAQLAGGKLVVRSTAPVEDLHALCAWLLDRGIDVDGVNVCQPTLEDTYLRLTSGAGS